MPSYHMTEQGSISIDFKRDWALILCRRLNLAGYSIDHNDSSDQVCIKYLNVLKRQINQCPRNVVASTEFTCSPAYAAGVALIRQKAENGEDLIPHQSRFLLDPDYNDALLNHWGIHHFHLGVLLEADGFIERTGPLLFARVTDTHFYMINICNHGHWTSQGLVEILHNNWPDEFGKHKCPGAVGLELKVSDNDIRQLRNAGVNTFIQVSDGSVYGSVGGGYSKSGLSIDVIRKYNSYMYFLKECEAYVVSNVQELATIAEQQGVEICPPFSFHLGLDSDNVYAIEMNSQFRFFLGGYTSQP